MNISITARGGKASDRLKAYIVEKLNRKERSFEGVKEVDVVLAYEKQTQIAEFKMKLDHKVLIISEKSEDIYKSVDMALDTAARQIKRHKEKAREHDNQKMADNLVVE
jgi:putative sigma-54 modulation protein